MPSNHSVCKLFVSITKKIYYISVLFKKQQQEQHDILMIFQTSLFSKLLL